jgi:hypothetical protein
MATRPRMLASTPMGRGGLEPPTYGL